MSNSVFFNTDITPKYDYISNTEFYNNILPNIATNYYITSINNAGKNIFREINTENLTTSYADYYILTYTINFNTIKPNDYNGYQCTSKNLLAINRIIAGKQYLVGYGVKYNEKLITNIKAISTFTSAGNYGYTITNNLIYNKDTKNYDLANPLINCATTSVNGLGQNQTNKAINNYANPYFLQKQENITYNTGQLQTLFKNSTIQHEGIGIFPTLQTSKNKKNNNINIWQMSNEGLNYGNNINLNNGKDNTTYDSNNTTLIKNTTTGTISKTKVTNLFLNKIDTITIDPGTAEKDTYYYYKPNIVASNQDNSGENYLLDGRANYNNSNVEKIEGFRNGYIFNNYANATGPNGPDTNYKNYFESTFTNVESPTIIYSKCYNSNYLNNQSYYTQYEIQYINYNQVVSNNANILTKLIFENTLNNINISGYSIGMLCSGAIGFMVFLAILRFAL